MKKVLFSCVLLMFFCVHASDMRMYQQAKEFYLNGDYTKAENHLNIVSEEIKAKPDYHKLLAQVYIAQQKFDLALEEYKLFQEGNLGINDRVVNKIIKILEGVSSDEIDNKVIHQLSFLLGDVNSTNSDFAPVITPDKKLMYYTSLKPALFSSENIWVAGYRNGIWTNTKLIEQLSTNGNESIGCISADGKKAYLFGNYEGATKGDIFLSNRSEGKWNHPVNISEINSSSTDMQPYVFNDIMFFASNRPESMGGFDLYVSEYRGVWTEPVNLGSVINTTLDEETPFFDWDGKTLYFASNGHPGLGELDVFKSIKIGDSWQDWSEPHNMGVIINSVRNDRCFTHAKNDNNWLLASDRVGGRGFEDIYQVYIADTVVSESSITKIHGIINDENGEAIPLVSISLYPQSSDNIQKRTVTSNQSGEYEVTLPGNETYRINLDKEGYKSFEEFIELTDIESEEFNFKLVKLDVQKPVEIDDIFFDFDKATLRKGSIPALDLLVRTLMVNSLLKAEISAHTCNIGNEEYNLKLSGKRANTVVNYLIEHGINEERLTSKGYGESMPKYSNETEAGREKNRRVEMVVKK